MERNTRQRQAVLDALAHSGQSLSPPEILLHAKSQVPTLNLSTVYRQIKALQDQAQIVKVELAGQPARFEAVCKETRAAVRDADEHAEHHHHHFHCTHCERVFPIHACPGPMNELAPPGFEVQRHDLTLHGLCAACVAGSRA